jgi:hypothetical protein
MGGDKLTVRGDGHSGKVWSEYGPREEVGVGIQRRWDWEMGIRDVEEDTNV